MELKEMAIVIRSTDYAENDKILTLLTADRGKITAGIKGVKKAGAKLKFAAQPFCFAEYLLSEKSGRYTVIGASEQESFYDLRLDVNKLYAASAVCEVASSLSFEGADGSVLFAPTVKALSIICSSDESKALIQFLWQALELAGYGLSPTECTECGNSLMAADKMRFDRDTGTFTCWDCSQGIGTSGTTYHTLRQLTGRSYDSAYLSADGIHRALRLLREYLTYKTDSKYPALTEYLRLLV